MSAMHQENSTAFGRLLLLLAVALFCSVSTAAEYAGRVVGVLDGDTVDVLTAEKRLVRIRLSGIDAPERRQPFAAASKKALSDFVYKHQVVVHGKKHDRYGRFVGKVLASGSDVNLTMVEQGLAWHYRAYAMEQSEADRAAYSDAEAFARESRRGLWRDSNPVPPWTFRRRPSSVE